VPGWGPEQRESEKTVLYLQIVIILISYIIIKLLIIENHPSWNRKQNSIFNCCLFFQNLCFRHLWQLKIAVFLHRCLIRSSKFDKLLFPGSEIWKIGLNMVARLALETGKNTNYASIHVVVSTDILGMFHLANSLVATRNRWLILLSKFV
jgi:hypothetical protein